MILFLRLFGFLLAHLPLPAIKALTALAGELFFRLARRRRRALLANLTHAFPERDYAWVLATGKKSIRQMVEFGLLAVALPRLNEERLRRIFFISPESETFLQKKAASGRPVVLLAPHLGPQEALCLLPFVFPGAPPIGGIYRPVNHPGVDTWIRQARERFGMRLFSRKRGLQNAIRLLKANQWLGLLFDQNSGKRGALITCLDRVASATDLPGILLARHEADAVFLYAARRRFWRIELCVEAGPATKDKEEINFAANRWLERLLLENEELLPGWLWAHNRWRHQRVPKLFLREKKNLLERQNVFLGREAIPRREPFFIRLPDRHEEVTALLPFLRAIRRSRPDVALSVIGSGELLPLVQGEGLCEQAIPLPRGGLGYFVFFWRLRRLFPSAYFVFHDDFLADLEALLSGAPHRFGIEQPGKRRVLLNRPWRAPADQPAEARREETWKAFLHANGLNESG